MERTGYETCNNQELFEYEEYYVDRLTDDSSQDECLEELHYIIVETEQRNQDNANAIMNH